MQVKVIYVVNETTKIDEFTCDSASYQIHGDFGNVFPANGYLRARRIRGALYAHPQVIYAYEDE